MLDHLALAEWPFQVTPDERSARLWADRREIHEELLLLLREYGRSRASTINLIWAYFGAGKTHLLRHLAFLASSGQPPMLPLYCVFPRTVRGFLDLYRVLAKTLSLERLAEAYVKCEQQGSLPTDLDPELSRACRQAVIRPDQHGVLKDWLNAGSYTLRDYREAGLSGKIATSERAIEVAVSAARLLTTGLGYHRLIWMIDEFQRIGELKEAHRMDVNVGLHSIYNELPTDFSMLLSFSFGDPANIRYLLSGELRDRARLQRYFQLPPLTQDDAFIFVVDLLKTHRSDAAKPDAFPFEEATIRAMIVELAASQGVALKPRTLMQAFNVVLTEADPLLEAGMMLTIEPEWAVSVLRRRLMQHTLDEPAPEF